MTYKILEKGFRHHGECACCGQETSMRDKKDGYLLLDADNEFRVLCRWCNSHVHSTGSDDAYHIDAEGSFCRSGQKFAIAHKNSPTYSKSGTQPEDLADGSAFV